MQQEDGGVRQSMEKGEMRVGGDRHLSRKFARNGGLERRDGLIELEEAGPRGQMDQLGSQPDAWILITACEDRHSLLAGDDAGRCFDQRRCDNGSLRKEGFLDQPRSNETIEV